MHLSGSQSALAHSIEQLKLIVTVSVNMNRAVFMDCTVLKPEAAGRSTSYRVRWRTNGDARIDMLSAGPAQTIWISDETISFAGADGVSVSSMPLSTIAPGPVWQPALEFRTPALLAKHMEEGYGLMQAGEKGGAGSGEFLIVGREGRQTVKVTIDSKTYLPRMLKKYAPDPDRANGEGACLLEVRFQWNQPIPGALFVPGPLAGTR
jgi:hypothetical protein